MSSPKLTTDNPVINDAFRIAVDDLKSNTGPEKKGLLKTPLPVIFAGQAYRDAWTRDAAINVWNGTSLILPEQSRHTLLSVLTEKDDKFYIGGELDQYWDAIIFATGAWQHYLATQDNDFLRIALQATVNTLHFFEETEFDNHMGLFRGPACYGDGISAYPDLYAKGAAGTGYIKRWPKRFPKLAAKNGFGLPMHALSTNCLYYAAYRIARDMAAAAGVEVDPSWLKRGDALRAAIVKHFWIKNKGSFRYLKDPNGDSDIQEGLGHSFVILFGIADKQQSACVFDNQHITPFGIPCLWPPYERYQKADPHAYGRHSGPVWPHIQGFWADAALRNNRPDIFEKELFTLASQAVKYGQFHEIYHPETGEPYGGEQECYKGESAPRQTWCATAFLRMVFYGLCGMRFSPEGLKLKPWLPHGIASLEIENLVFRNTKLAISIKRIEGQDGAPKTRLRWSPQTMND